MSVTEPAWPELLLRAVLPVAVALLGGAAGALGTERDRALAMPFVHFAAGAFLAAALLHLLPEAAELGGWPLALAAAACGWAFCSRLSAWAGIGCPACEHGARPEGTRPLLLSRPLLAIVAVHSALDGVALGGPHGAAEVSLAVLLHKFPEGLAVAAVCRAAGAGVGGALLRTVAVEACTFAGLLAAGALGRAPEGVLGAAVAVVAGSFLYLVALTWRGSRSGGYPASSAWIAVAGASAVMATRLTLR